MVFIPFSDKRSADTEPPNPEPTTMALKLEPAVGVVFFLQDDNENVLQPNSEADANVDNPKNLLLCMLLKIIF